MQPLLMSGRSSSARWQLGDGAVKVVSTVQKTLANWEADIHEELSVNLAERCRSGIWLQQHRIVE